MRRRAWACFLIGIAIGASTSAATVVVKGTVFTQRQVDAVRVRVWAEGDALVADSARAERPLTESTAVPGTAFSLEVAGAALPLRVEAFATGHVGAAFSVVLPEQLALPVLWLPAGREREVRVEGVGAAAVRVTGTIHDMPSREVALGRWAPVIPWTDVDAKGIARVVLPMRDRPLALIARAADGRWGAAGVFRPRSQAPVVRIESRSLRVEVRDKRDRPVAGVAVAAASAPAGGAAIAGDNGSATVQVPAEGEWAVVAVGKGLAGRRVVRAAAVAPVRVTVRAAETVRVVCAGAGTGRTALAWTPWVPAALGGDVPGVLAAGGGALTFLAPGGQMQLGGPGIAAESVAVPAAEPAVAVRFAAAARAEGRVVDERGEGVAGIPVWSWSIPGFQGYPRRSMGAFRPEMLARPLLPAAVSGADGRFAVADLLPGPQRFTAFKAGLPEADSDALEAAAGGSVAVTLTLARGASLALTVHDPDGRALAGTEVKAWAVPVSRANEPRFGASLRGRGGEPAATATAAADGRVVLAPLAPGAVTLELAAPGYVRRSIDATVDAAGTDLGVQVLEPGVEVLGRVVDEAGNGVAEVNVMIEDMPGMAFGEPVASSDAAGHFTIADRPRGGELRLVARGEKVVPAAAVVVRMPPEGPVELRVRRARTLTGRVVDERDGEPVAGARVAVHKEITLAASRTMMSAGQAESGEDGAFRVEGLGVGGYVVEVESPGYTPQRLDVTVPEGEAPRPLTVILRRGLAVAGRVEEADGSPAAGVFVDLGSAASEQSLAGRDNVRRSARSDPEGAFRFDGLAPGRYQVGAGDDAGAGASEVVEAGAADEVVLRLRPPGSLVCRVGDPDSAPVAGAEVRVFPVSAAVTGPQRQRTDATGTATFPSVAAQRYRVSVAAPGWPQANREVSVTAGQQAEVTVTLARGGTVIGRIVGLTSEQMARLDVWARGARARVAADGSFRLEGVALGPGEVRASLHPEGRERGARFELADADTPVTVEIDFAGGATVSGVVRRGGRAAAGLTVECVRVNSPEGSTVTDDTGHYRFDGIDDGELDVTVRDDVGAPLAARRVIVSGATRVDFDVAAGEVAGRVVEAETRDGVSGADVVLRSASGAEVVRSLQSSETGAFRVGELADGDYTLRASAPGYAPATAAIHLTMGRVPDVTLSLTGEQRLELLLTEADGAPADSVLIVPKNGGRVLDGLWAHCDGRGRAVVTSLPPGGYAALVSGRGAALVALSVPSAGARVTLAPAGRLQILAPAGNGAPWRVRVMAPDGGAVPVSPWHNPDRGEWVALHDRTLALRVPAGAYTVQAIDPAGGTHERRVDVPADGEAIARFGD
jgi:protocatechuate 3,4-dioxygenase beta subunit